MVHTAASDYRYNTRILMCIIHTHFYTILRKILKLQSEYFLAHLVMTIYINYHFVWVIQRNLNIIKEHITFKQHLWNIVTELLH